MSTQLHRYQLSGVRRIERFKGRALLADEMGLGKTVQALFYIKRNPEVKPVVVVCPASLKWHWEREARIHIGLYGVVLESRKRMSLRNEYDARPNLVIINYDILKAWLPELSRLDPELVILDEAHYLKSRFTQRTGAVQELCEYAPHVIALSGTPLTNRPAELWPILNIVKPTVFPEFWPFAIRHCRPKKGRWGYEFKGAARLRELHRKLKKHVMIRRRKIDVLDELPKKSETVVPVALSKKDMAEYEFARRSFVQWLGQHNPKKVAKAMRAEALMKVGYLRRLVARMKQKHIINWVDNYLEESGRKLLVFTVHKKYMLYALEDHFGKLCCVVDGDVVGKERQRQFDRFNLLDRKRLMLGQIGPAGTGWSCKVTSTVLFTEPAWSPGEHDQAFDRVHGLNRGLNGMPAEAYWILAKGTIDEDIYKLVKEKGEVIKKILDGVAIKDDESILDKLISLWYRREKND